MEFMHGVPINDTKRIREMGVNLHDVAKILGTCFSQQIFNHGYVHADPHPGNIFVSSFQTKEGKIQPQVVLLDHGLYANLDDDTRLQYSYLWKGILTQNETLVKESSEKLGVKEFWPLFAAMIVAKTYEDIMANDEQDMQSRLKQNGTKVEKQKLQSLAQTYQKDILKVMNECNRDLLLLFKVNDFLRTLFNQLGNPVKNFEITAKHCFDAIEHVEKKQNRGVWHRLRFVYERFRINFGLTIFSYYLRIKMLFGNSGVPALALGH